MKEFNIGDIVYFEHGLKGRGKILEKNVWDDNNWYLLEMIDECNRGKGHNGGGSDLCIGKYKGGNCWYVPVDNSTIKLVAPANSESIHITRDGDKVHAIFKYEDRVVKHTEVKCHPDDTLDFFRGAKIALNRLSEEEKNEKKDDNEIKVGDTVKVVNKGRLYSTYYSWFNKYAPELASRYAYNGQIKKLSAEYEVLAVHEHELQNAILCAIQEKTDDSSAHPPIYLINTAGVRKSSHNSHLENIDGSFYGLIGQNTTLRDAEGIELSVGDVVEVTSATNGTNYGLAYVVKDKDFDFVMGIKGDCSSGTIDSSEWLVFKRKSYKALENGEKHDDIRAVLE